MSGAKVRPLGKREGDVPIGPTFPCASDLWKSDYFPNTFPG